MQECGFTIGGFYRRFASKEELVVEAIGEAFEAISAFISGKISEYGGGQRGLNAAIADYLSVIHRDSEHGGCPASALPRDAARSGENVQAAYANGVERYLDLFSAEIGGSKQAARQQAIGTLSGMVGAVLLSRAVKKSNPKLSKEILRSANKYISTAATR
jgi:TetR/AcrR family transcriptional regulator, transcriptional repressor for nem operon